MLCSIIFSMKENICVVWLIIAFYRGKFKFDKLKHACENNIKNGSIFALSFPDKITPKMDLRLNYLIKPHADYIKANFGAKCLIKWQSWLNSLFAFFHLNLQNIARN